ncbi:adrenodoxin-like [Anomaloglossus baeobatrachus]|uniref:adrenodoxin-like n=2 Tax=Anomaloglossus baeobatrachus TaxID=238106 RepID=UPI003F50AFCA
MAHSASTFLRTLYSRLHGPMCCKSYISTQALSKIYTRSFTTSAKLQDAKSNPGTSEENLKVNFINRDGEILTASAKEGESLLEVVIRHHLNIDGFGACEGTLACSTCHLIFDQKAFDQLSSVTDEEMDMLDLAFGLTQTSRLGCQICMTKAIDGITVRVPKDLSDARRDQIEKQSKQ